MEPREFLALVAVDFTGDATRVDLAAKDERIKMTRLSMSLLAAPFAAAVALASAKVVSPQMLTTWHSVPWHLFAMVAAFGLLSVLPFLRLIEAVNAHMRTARAAQQFPPALRCPPQGPVRGPRLDSLTCWWHPRYPETYAPMAWPGDQRDDAGPGQQLLHRGRRARDGRGRPTVALLLVIIGLLALVHDFVYYVRANVSRQRRLPHNPFHFPNVET